MMAGSATVLACDHAIEKGRRGMAHLSEADVGDIEFADGTFRVVGTDRAISILELAQRMRASEMPEGLSGGLDNVAKFVSPQMSFPNGCHVCEVEIDPQTGVVAVVAYTAIDDVGNVLHETIVAGQIHGGVAQGLGQVLGEQVIYGDRRPAADGVVHGLLHAARRRRAASCRSSTMSFRAPPTRSAPRAPASPGSRARCRRR